MNPFLEIMNGLGIRCNELYAKELFYVQGLGFTLLGIKRMLEHYGVKVEAVHIEKPSLDGLTFPLVCQCNERLRLLTAPPTDLNQFYAQWNGYALLCDASGAHEPHYWSNFFREKVLRIFPWAITVLGVLAVLGFLMEPFTWGRTALVLFNLVGLYYSYLSVIEECAGSCHAVTESAGGKLLGRFSLGVVGLSYFSVSLLPTLFVPAWLPLWRWIALFALIMPLWSFCYQAFVVKQWCRNCVIVQVQVLLSAAVVVSSEGSWREITPITWVALPALYLGVLAGLDRVAWLYQQVKSPKTPTAWLDLLADPLLRQRILTAGRAIDVSHVGDLFTFNPEGKEELCVALSLTCRYCQESYLQLFRLVRQGALDNYCIHILIGPTVSQLERVREAIIASARQEGALKAGHRLADWYESPQVKRFLRRLPPSLDLEAVRPSLAVQADEVAQWHLASLPAFVLNGYQVEREIWTVVMREHEKRK